MKITFEGTPEELRFVRELWRGPQLVSAGLPMVARPGRRAMPDTLYSFELKRQGSQGVTPSTTRFRYDSDDEEGGGIGFKAGVLVAGIRVRCWTPYEIINVLVGANARGSDDLGRLLFHSTRTRRPDEELRGDEYLFEPFMAPMGSRVVIEAGTHGHPEHVDVDLLGVVLPDSNRWPIVGRECP
jgi:hypothetical protein